jgi:hypothetical protein
MYRYRYWTVFCDGRLDPGPGGLKRAKKEGKNASKRQIIRFKRIKSK